MFFEQLVKMGGHLGHAPRSWHPKMAPYIVESRDGVHILDLVQKSTKEIKSEFYSVYIFSCCCFTN